MKYPNGKTLPINICRAMEFTGKVGFLSRQLWYDQFSNGSKRWQEKQLDKVLKAKLLKPYPNSAVTDYFSLTSSGRELLENQNLSVVGHTNANQLQHDEVVARSLLQLTKAGLIHHWKTEAELKRAQVKEYQLSRDLRNKKYPDGVFKILALGKERTIAFEYERTMKASRRYNGALWLYSKMDSFGMIIFVCENNGIESALRRRMDHMKLPNLWSRVAFASILQWQENPATAPIRLGDKTITLRELCENLRDSQTKDVAA